MVSKQLIQQVREKLLPQIGNIILVQSFYPRSFMPSMTHDQLGEILVRRNRGLDMLFTHEGGAFNLRQTARIIAPNREILYADSKLLKEWEDKFQHAANSPEATTIEETVLRYQRLLFAYAEPVKEVLFE